MKTQAKKTPEQEAIAFLRSMLKLVERRRLRYVDEQFGLTMTAMAHWMLDPEDVIKDSRHKDAINAATGLIEEFLLPGSPGVPVSVLKAVVMVIEEALQEPDCRQPIRTPQEVTQ
jgi:hypothetical protein